MKDFVLNRAEMLGEADTSWSLSHLWRHWKARRQVQRLKDMDERLLDDIGVTREELHWASRLPLTVNAALALEERAFRRRLHERDGLAGRR